MGSKSLFFLFEFALRESSLQILDVCRSFGTFREKDGWSKKGLRGDDVRFKFEKKSERLLGMLAWGTCLGPSVGANPRILVASKAAAPLQILVCSVTDGVREGCRKVSKGVSVFSLVLVSATAVNQSPISDWCSCNGGDLAPWAQWPHDDMWSSLWNRLERTARRERARKRKKRQPSKRAAIFANGGSIDLT